MCFHFVLLPISAIAQKRECSPPSPPPRKYGTMYCIEQLNIYVSSEIVGPFVNETIRNLVGMIRKVAPYTDFAGYPAIFFTCSKRFGAKYTRIFFTVYLDFNNCDSCWTICRDSSSDLYNGLHHRWSSFCLGHSQHNGLQC